MRTITKNVVLASALSLFFSLTAGAEGAFVKTKMSPWLQSQYSQQQTAVKKNGGALRIKGKPLRRYVMTLVQSSDDGATVRQKGGVVWQQFGEGICAAFLPIDSLGVLDRSSSILCMEANAPSRVLNDTSAVLIGVDKIRESGTPAAQLPQAFTGKGVIAAVMDMSFDFTHPSFRNADGTSRIQWFWDPVAENSDPDALGLIYDSPEKVLEAQCTVDAVFNEPHGTHVMGSMAGSGLDGRYVGMAPEADIMGAHVLLGAENTSERVESFANYVKKHLQDWPGMEDAVVQVEGSSVVDVVELKGIFQQADAAGKPCVVNWSFGSGANFTDSYKLYETVLSQMLGPGRILMVAAGNEGHMKTYVRKEADEPMKQSVYMKGTKDAPSHTYCMQIRVKDEDDVYFKMAWVFEGIKDTIFIDTEEIVEQCSQNDGSCELHLPELTIGIMLVSMPGGYYGYQMAFMPNDGGFEKPEDIEATLIINTPATLEFCGVNMGELLKFDNLAIGETRGCNMHTLGFPGSMERVITVGAMHHRSSYTNFQGKPASYKKLGSEEGHLANFSSCGPGVTDLIKPDVVAPGHNIISAMSAFYMKNNSEEDTREEEEPLIALKANAFGKDYAVWSMSGTSMATPISSGVVALWLQAKPDLTPEDIKAVIQRTSHQPEPEFSGNDKNIYYGWGEIDAYAGLLDILGIETSIPQLSKHQPAGVTFSLTGRTLYISGLSASVPLTVYDLNGRTVLRTVTASGTVELPSLPAGVYAVQLGGQGSTLIRLYSFEA